MNGYVSQHHVLLNLPVRLPDNSYLEIECVLDTGFTGYLTLHAEAISALNLPFIRSMPATLADNSTILVDVYAAAIRWQGEEREEEVLATGKRPLIGTLLLEGSEICIQFSEGGSVRLEAI